MSMTFSEDRNYLISKSGMKYPRQSILDTRSVHGKTVCPLCKICGLRIYVNKITREKIYPGHTADWSDEVNNPYWLLREFAGYEGCSVYLGTNPLWGCVMSRQPIVGTIGDAAAALCSEIILELGEIACR